MIEELSENMENYLETIWELERVNKVARVKEIAERLGIRSGSASGALKNLAEKGLINYEPYSFITLTDEGRMIAEDIAHRHEVLKDFLENILHIDPEIADKTACKMEHAIDELTKERLMCFIEYIRTCPRAGKQWLRSFVEYCERGGREGEACKRCIGEWKSTH